HRRGRGGPRRLPPPARRPPRHPHAGGRRRPHPDSRGRRPPARGSHGRVRSPVSAARRVKPQTEHRTIRTPDGTRIAYTWWRRPSKELLILAPGFWRIRLAEENLFLAEHFLRRGVRTAAQAFCGARRELGEIRPGACPPAQPL